VEEGEGVTAEFCDEGVGVRDGDVVEGTIGSLKLLDIFDVDMGIEVLDDIGV
jgi:hypothetical protein